MRKREQMSKNWDSVGNPNRFRGMNCFHRQVFSPPGWWSNWCHHPQQDECNARVTQLDSDGHHVLSESALQEGDSGRSCQFTQPSLLAIQDAQPELQRAYFGVRALSWFGWLIRWYLPRILKLTIGHLRFKKGLNGRSSSERFQIIKKRAESRERKSRERGV